MATNVNPKQAAQFLTRFMVGTIMASTVFFCATIISVCLSEKEIGEFFLMGFAGSIIAFWFTFGGFLFIFLWWAWQTVNPIDRTIKRS
jgi:hypothetical protein